MKGNKRIIDYDKLWTSHKLSLCRPASRPEYTWMYGIADANGVFEYDPKAIHSSAYATIRDGILLSDILVFLNEFKEHGLLFTWEQKGKLWGYWVGANKPGRLPTGKNADNYHRLSKSDGIHPPSPPQIEQYLQSCAEQEASQQSGFTYENNQEFIARKRREGAESILENQTRLEEQAKRDAHLARFSEFWKLYPEKRRDQNTWQYAQQTFLQFSDTEIDQLFLNLALWKTSSDWTKDDGRWIVGIEKFLAGKWKEHPTGNGANGASITPSPEREINFLPPRPFREPDPEVAKLFEQWQGQQAKN